MLQDNFRLYYANKDEKDAFCKAWQDGTGSVVKLRGPAFDAQTAPGGDYVLVLLDGFGFLCFLRLPESLVFTDDDVEVDGVVCKVMLLFLVTLCLDDASD